MVLLIFFREMIECFPLMARQLGDLNTRLENIVWTNKFSIEDSNMVCFQTSSFLPFTYRKSLEFFISTLGNLCAVLWRVYNTVGDIQY